MRCCWNLMLIPFKTAPKNPQIHGDMFHGLLGFFFPADLLLSRAWKWRNGGRERGRAMPGTSQTFSMPCPTSESSKFGRHRPLPAAPVVTASAAPSQGTLFVEFSPCRNSFPATAKFWIHLQRRPFTFFKPRTWLRAPLFPCLERNPALLL